MAWATLALLNVVMLEACLPRGGVKRSVRLLHHAYDGGHLLLLGAASAVVVWAWERWGPSRLERPALFVVAYAIGLLTLREDLANFLISIPWLPHWASYAALVAGVAALVPVTWLMGRYVGRTRFRWPMAVAAIVLAAANHLVLPLTYPGIHLFTAWIAALAIAAAIVEQRERTAGGWLFGRRANAVAILLFAALGIASVFIAPPRSVWRELFRSPGTVLAPFLAEIVPAPAGRHPPLAIEASPWFRSRAEAPAVGASKPTLIEKPIVILITVDALRPDVVLKHPERFPTLSRVREQSVEFETARAPSPSTVTTITSLFTGKYYSSLVWREVEPGVLGDQFKGAIMPHKDESPRVAELLSRAGVQTVQVVQARGLSRELGVGTGFAEQLLLSRHYAPVAETASVMVDRLKRAGDAPLFMYTHVIEPHAPYDLAGKHGGEYEAYLREVELVDKALAKLEQALSEPKLRARTILVISADHGEAFGEHGLKYHAVSLYEAMIRVPLYVRLPSRRHALVDEPVSLIDLGPTVLDLFGVSTPGHFMGESLVPFLRGARPKLSRPIALDAGRRIQALFFPDGMKAIVDLRRNTEEVYNLRTDPGELENLIDAEPEQAMQHIGALRTFFRAHRAAVPGYEVPWRPF